MEGATDGGEVGGGGGMRGGGNGKGWREDKGGRRGGGQMNFETWQVVWELQTLFCISQRQQGILRIDSNHDHYITP